MSTTEVKNRHTPGPWVQAAERDGRHTTHYIKVGPSIVYTQRGVGMTEEEVIANARLIAAAPEMLHALTEVIRELGTEVNAFYAERSKAFVLASAAIAKAKGGA